MNLRIFDDLDDLSRGVARTILQRTSVEARTSIGISGGSTPRPLYELLGADPLRAAMVERPITWVVVDERYVPAEDPQSNAWMIRQTLFREGVPAAHRFLEFRTDFEDPHASATRFEEEWRALGLDALDIVILGVGEDGHTASLFPGTQALDVEDRIAAAVFVPRLDQWRVTLTLPVIRAAKLRIVQAAGEAKAGVIRDVGAGVDHPVTRATAGLETWWFVDRAATAG